MRLPDRRPSAAVRGYDGRWQRFRKWFLRHNPLCIECNAAASVADHIVPLAQGGAHCDPDNTQSLCATCHNRKTATHDGGFGHARRDD